MDSLILLFKALLDKNQEYRTDVTLTSFFKEIKNKINLINIKQWIIKNNNTNDNPISAELYLLKLFWLLIDNSFDKNGIKFYERYKLKLDQFIELENNRNDSSYFKQNNDFLKWLSSLIFSNENKKIYKLERHLDLRTALLFSMSSYRKKDVIQIFKKQFIDFEQKIFMSLCFVTQ